MARVTIACFAWAFAVIACKAKAGASCLASTDCQTGLVCEEARCVACPDTKACRSSGLCAARQSNLASGCIATDDGCRASSACTIGNRCHARGPDTPMCVSKGDDCAGTRDCNEYGWCTPNSDGTCSAGSNESCKASVACSTLGHCTLKDGRCAAGSDDDCKARSACTTIGYCSAKDGECVAGRDADCEPTQSCKVLGHCTAAGGTCVLAKNEDCRGTLGCQEVGSCSMRGDQCVVSEDADCKRSTACAKEARCRAKPAAASAGTSDRGACIKG